MNTLELQHELIKNIIDIQDLHVLHKLRTFLQTLTPQPYTLSDLERNVLSERRKSKKNKLSNEQVFNEIEKCL